MEITQNPQELKKLAGFRTVAEVYRTLDKLAIRKEYHEALLRHGMDLDAIVGGIKGVAENSEEDAVKLNAYKTLLKSLGLDVYKESESNNKETWEDLIRNADSTKEIKKVEDKYDVIIPMIPDDVQKQRNEENKFGQDLYNEK
jgi:hypothetical protein